MDAAGIDAQVGEAPDAAVEPTCTDGQQNGDEEGVDCGGSCDPCIECGDNDECASGLCADGTCQTSQLVACTDVAPANATSTVENVVILWDETDGWSEPADCAWQCDLNYDEVGGACINERTVSCTDAAPANATSTPADVVITYTTAGGWTTPADCAWSCNLNYDNVGGACLNERTVSCNDAAPANATSTPADVVITYTTAGGWTTPADCAWSCNLNYDNVGGSCINSRTVSCNDAAPANATSTPANVVITYTTAGGWTTPADCAWSCNLNYDNVGGSCINSRTVSCNDAAPANATSTPANVVITYTTAGGWTTPADCAWNCNLNYDNVGGSCINERTVSCNDAAPANATSDIADVLITYTTAGGWTEPADCEWRCNPDYDLVSGACINEQIVPCNDAPPANATSILEDVVITYTTDGGWTAPADCAWLCDACSDATSCEYGYTDFVFERADGDSLGYVSLGVSPAVGWSVGVGQSVKLTKNLHMGQFAVKTSSGFPEPADVMLQLRDLSGAELKRVVQTVPASIGGGWMWFDLDYELAADVEYVFTLHVPDALKKGIDFSLSLPAVLGDKYLDGVRYYDHTTNEDTDPLHLPTNFYPINADIEFWVRSVPECPAA